MPARTLVKVEQDPEAPIEKPVLAKAIVDISDSLTRLGKSGLNQRAVVALVHDHNGLPKKTITAVLSSLMVLRANYCR
jgi:hypothetical protein